MNCSTIILHPKIANWTGLSISAQTFHFFLFDFQKPRIRRAWLKLQLQLQVVALYLLALALCSQPRRRSADRPSLHLLFFFACFFWCWVFSSHVESLAREPKAEQKEEREPELPCSRLQSDIVTARGPSRSSGPRVGLCSRLQRISIPLVRINSPQACVLVPIVLKDLICSGKLKLQMAPRHVLKWQRS